MRNFIQGGFLELFEVGVRKLQPEILGKRFFGPFLLLRRMCWKFRISRYSRQSSGWIWQTIKIFGYSCLNNSSSFTSSDEFSISSETIDKSIELVTVNESIESNSLLSSGRFPQRKFKGEPSMADTKSPEFQWVLPNSTSKIFWQ